jgi:uncharacterized membrane protein YeaQ/YmgE (transglycosylase-associated protein family)
MHFLIWLVVGSVVGVLAAVVMGTGAQQSMALNVATGIAGALLGGWLLAPVFGIGTIRQDDFGLSSLFVSFLAALLLIAAVNFSRRGRSRRKR